MEDIREMLKKVAAGELSVDNAVLELKKEPFTAAGYDDLDSRSWIPTGSCVRVRRK